MLSAVARVLVIDGGPLVVQALAAAGHEVVLEGSTDSSPDLVIADLDGGRPLDGMADRYGGPLIVLSAGSEPAHVVAALDAGADDYVRKPFVVAELLARTHAVLRRGHMPAEPIVTTEAFTVDLGCMRVTKAGRDVHLTPTEWGILEMLVRHRGKLVGQADLLTQVWGASRRDRTHYLRVYLAQLRRKLEDNPARPQHLITVTGMGYRLVV